MHSKWRVAQGSLGRGGRVQTCALPIGETREIMQVNNTSFWLTRVALFVVFCAAATASSAAAQVPRQVSPDLATILKPGMTVWITDSRGREEKTRIVDVSS